MAFLARGSLLSRCRLAGALASRSHFAACRVNSDAAIQFPKLNIVAALRFPSFRSDFGAAQRRLLSSDSSPQPPKIDRPASMGTRGIQEPPAKNKTPVGWVNLAVTGFILCVLYGAYKYAMSKKEYELAKQRKAAIGKAKIGGSFDLVDHNGKASKSSDFYGKWILLYFGFTHCPDICPDEMEKLSEVVDMLKSSFKKGGPEVVPLFITVDPERDGVKEVAEYVKEFHPEMIGLTGSIEKVKEACKAFRVYFSAGPRDDDDDYIVDHTIIIYLLDPDGGFVDYYGQTKNAEQIKTAVMLQMAKYEQLKKKSTLAAMLSG